MDFKIVHNTPYVVLLMGLSLLLNMILHIATPWTMLLTWLVEYYIVFWFYQTYVPKKDDFSWKSFAESKMVIACFLLAGGLIGHHVYFGPVRIITCITYAIFIPIVLALMEYSLYN